MFFFLVVRIIGAGIFDDKNPPPLPDVVQRVNTPKLTEDDYFDLREGRMKGNHF